MPREEKAIVHRLLHIAPFSMHYKQPRFQTCLPAEIRGERGDLIATSSPTDTHIVQSPAPKHVTTSKSMLSVGSTITRAVAGTSF